MEREDVELVRRALEAFNRRDLEGSLACFSEEITWEVRLGVMPDATSYRGHDGVRRFWAAWTDTFEGFHLAIEELEEAGEGRVLAVTRAEGTGSGSGAPVASRSFCQLYYVDGGEVTRVRLFSSKRAALAAT